MVARVSAMGADNSTTLVPLPMDESFGAATTRSIIGTTDLVRTWKQMPYLSHDWRLTFFRCFRSWKIYASLTPGAVRSTLARGLVLFGEQRIMEKQHT